MTCGRGCWEPAYQQPTALDSPTHARSSRTRTTTNTTRKAGPVEPMHGGARRLQLQPRDRRGNRGGGLFSRAPAAVCCNRKPAVRAHCAPCRRLRCKIGAHVGGGLCWGTGAKGRWRRMAASGETDWPPSGSFHLGRGAPVPLPRLSRFVWVTGRCLALSGSTWFLKPAAACARRKPLSDHIQAASGVPGAAVLT